MATAEEQAPAAAGAVDAEMGRPMDGDRRAGGAWARPWRRDGRLGAEFRDDRDRYARHDDVQDAKANVQAAVSRPAPNHPVKLENCHQNCDEIFFHSALLEGVRAHGGVFPS